MSKRRSPDGSDRRGPSVPIWVWPLLALPVVVLLVAGVVVVGGVWLFTSAPISTVRQSAPNVQSRPTYTREEVRAVWNSTRTPEGIKAKFGLPDKTTEEFHEWRMKSSDPLQVGGGGTDRITVYHYYGLSRDAAGSGKVDAEVVMRFIAAADSLQFRP